VAGVERLLVHKSHHLWVLIDHDYGSLTLDDLAKYAGI